MILISPHYKQYAAAKAVEDCFLDKLRSQTEHIIRVGINRSDSEPFRIDAIIRYMLLLGPYFDLKKWLEVIQLSKGCNKLVLNSSHYLLLGYLCKLWNPALTVELILHNRELVFYLEGMRYNFAKRRLGFVLSQSLKLPYNLLLGLLENRVPDVIHALSTKDIRSNSRVKFDFLDLVSDYRNVSGLNFSDKSKVGFIGNDFWNNSKQIEEFVSIFGERELQLYGSVRSFNVNHKSYGRYSRVGDIEVGAFWLGTNATGFPTKFVEYNKSEKVIITKSNVSLNILVHPRVKIV